MSQISVNEDMFLYKSKIKYLDLPSTLNSLYGKDVEEFKVQLIIFNNNFIKAIDEYGINIKGLQVLKLYESSVDQASYEISGSFGRSFFLSKISEIDFFVIDFTSGIP